MAEANSWNIGQILDWTQGYLKEKGDSSAAKSAQVLLGHILGLSRVELICMRDRPLTEAERASMRLAVQRRAQGEPLQYIVGKAAFRHLEFEVRPGVLIPRPETEVLVSEVISALKERSKEAKEAHKLAQKQRFEIFAQFMRDLIEKGASPLDSSLNPDDLPEGVVLQDGVPLFVEEPFLPPTQTVFDVCCGSSCIGASLAHELPHLKVYLSDIADEAFSLTKENLRTLGLRERTEVLQGDLLEPYPDSLRGKVDAIVSNPPYIPQDILAKLSSEVVDFEPRLALDGGCDGHEIFKRLTIQALDFLAPGGFLAVELHEEGMSDALTFVQDLGYDHARIVKDLAGKERFICAYAPVAS